jgi:tetratricopeptide (TPR) repeat protein
VTSEQRKKQAYARFKAGEPDEALTIVSAILNENPKDVTALFMAAEILGAAHRHGLAEPIYRRIVELDPTLPAAWNNLGLCHHKADNVSEGVECYVKALYYGGDDFDAYNNLMLLNTVMGDHENALRLYNRSMYFARNAEDRKTATSNSTLSNLALRHWKEGWAGFELMLDALKQRKKRAFGVPDWNGQPVDGLIAVYGEQGLGDEIMFASMIPDMIAAGHKPVIECDPRLQGLYRRSFPCPVFGTRPERNPGWVYSMPVKAKTAVGSLAKFYRTSEPFPKRAYLKPCPIRRKHFRGALDKLPGRKIGIAFTGGVHSTRTKDRSLTQEDLKPLLSLPGITWVSLEYKGDGIPGVFHWPEITQTKDYDDTAALVAELDHVVSVTTTVALLCGALGKPCDVLVSEHPTWHWSAQGDMPWYDCLRLWRRDGVSWKPLVSRLSQHLTQAERMAAQ